MRALRVRGIAYAHALHDERVYPVSLCTGTVIPQLIRVIVGKDPMGGPFFHSGVRRRKYKLGKTNKICRYLFHSFCPVYISSSSPHCERKHRGVLSYDQRDKRGGNFSESGLKSE